MPVISPQNVQSSTYIVKSIYIYILNAKKCEFVVVNVY